MVSHLFCFLEPPGRWSNLWALSGVKTWGQDWQEGARFSASHAKEREVSKKNTFVVTRLGLQHVQSYTLPLK